MTLAADLSHRDLGAVVSFDVDGDAGVVSCVGELLWIVAAPNAVSVTLRHHGEPYNLLPSQPVEIETPVEASGR